jgi:salicylate hydroxylase
LKSASVIVAGGGIGGLAAALALARSGQQVTVLERAADFADIGAGIQLGPNAMRVLAAWGLQVAVLAKAYLPQAIALRSASSARLLQRIRLGDAVQQRYGQVYACIHRADLHAILLQAVRAQAEVQLITNAQVQSISQAVDDDLVQLQTTDQSWSAPAVIAADGLWSAVRQALWSDGAPRATGHIALRSLVPMQHMPEGARWRNEVGVHLGRGMHVVHYPVRSGDALNVVVISEQAQLASAAGWSQPVPHGVVQGCTQGTSPMLQTLLAAVAAHGQPWQGWHLFDRPSAASWVRGRVALLGDAAHPMLPYLAQGAAMALEDAYALGQCAAQSSDWPNILQRYQQLRQQRCERVVHTAQRNGRIFHLAAPLSWARDAVLMSQGSPVLGMPWLYGASAV